MSYYANTRPLPIQYRGPLFAQTSSVPAQPHNRAYKGLNNYVTAAALPPSLNAGVKGERPLESATHQSLPYATYQSLNNRRRPTRPVQAQYYMDYAVAQGLSTSPVSGPKTASHMNGRFVGPLNLVNAK